MMDGVEYTIFECAETEYRWTHWAPNVVESEACRMGECARGTGGAGGRGGISSQLANDPQSMC